MIITQCNVVHAGWGSWKYQDAIRANSKPLSFPDVAAVAPRILSLLSQLFVLYITQIGKYKRCKVKVYWGRGMTPTHLSSPRNKNMDI
jgi:hypothetical protein